MGAGIVHRRTSRRITSSQTQPRSNSAERQDPARRRTRPEPTSFGSRFGRPKGIIAIDRDWGKSHGWPESIKSSGRPCGKQFREYHTRTSTALFFDVLRQVSRLFLWSPYTRVLYLCALVCGFEGRAYGADETWAQVLEAVADVWSAVNRGVLVRRLGWVGVVSWAGS
ncbi:hypothetical protein ASPCAL04298 [Aspergillus calidoustus]|uniref:Uncharacterized protein n=1 Tax=Aspergillus calidoustus TaxID=454130 RepID=A0A0U4Z0N0_ASPCI|nr:hypothetical protein ASPCAL04298 [Aspergillus calidoustus]